MKYYPVFWNIAGKKCVVVGGGDVAARKVTRLLDCNAKVCVVSPGLVPELEELKRNRLIDHVNDAYESKYLNGAVLVIGATDDEKINDAISKDAKEKNLPVNIVDDPQKCDFILPSLIERGDLTIACSTGGQSPALARYLREELELVYGEEYAVLASILGQLRTKMEKNAGVGKTWFNQLMSAGLLDAIRIRDTRKVKTIVRDITGEEIILG
ncbi:MAG TPA: bifunctional precorrin-2 dehydrogenase/sirohydrochlorin ferrochelatase [Smithellaceae bacterium]|nr:bifunctional precorrin-2 dehydrogenase/sirohydrochlorin ferrochelatase [Smithella sp.]HNZ10950.1 bifunctional precorrin-2 dehydrogenase/sirohydrochlorin ferrochelatase [Smithellaceae bacterium]HOG80931.1 bifunctional precorrin-2 dehydrogenase/sirohydrochlorin ferrochelatase [Smithellaceae bacterium]HOQ42218.1 bifunctional precorrin-2 dehydrogenase/sirohydrochlorin ferrochelatase [Smithellaceae bacterium]HPL65542.1 bifunctional precorrin-2 dehydrogenase/sirohydrochlorin ferrochelatase [Smithe